MGFKDMFGILTFFINNKPYCNFHHNHNQISFGFQNCKNIRRKSNLHKDIFYNNTFYNNRRNYGNFPSKQNTKSTTFLLFSKSNVTSSWLLPLRLARGQRLRLVHGVEGGRGMIHQRYLSSISSDLSGHKGIINYPGITTGKLMTKTDAKTETETKTEIQIEVETEREREIKQTHKNAFMMRKIGRKNKMGTIKKIEPIEKIEKQKEQAHFLANNLNYRNLQDVLVYIDKNFIENDQKFSPKTIASIWNRVMTSNSKKVSSSLIHSQTSQVQIEIEKINSARKGYKKLINATKINFLKKKSLERRKDINLPIYVINSSMILTCIAKISINQLVNAIYHPQGQQQQQKQEQQQIKSTSSLSHLSSFKHNSNNKNKNKNNSSNMSDYFEVKYQCQQDLSEVCTLIDETLKPILSQNLQERSEREKDKEELTQFQQIQQIRPLTTANLLYSMGKIMSQRKERGPSSVPLSLFDNSLPLLLTYIKENIDIYTYNDLCNMILGLSHLISEKKRCSQKTQKMMKKRHDGDGHYFSNISSTKDNCNYNYSDLKLEESLDFLVEKGLKPCIKTTPPLNREPLLTSYVLSSLVHSNYFPEQENQHKVNACMQEEVMGIEGATTWSSSLSNIQIRGRKELLILLKNQMKDALKINNDNHRHNYHHPYLHLQCPPRLSSTEKTGQLLKFPEYISFLYSLTGIQVRKQEQQQQQRRSSKRSPQPLHNISQTYRIDNLDFIHVLCKLFEEYVTTSLPEIFRQNQNQKHLAQRQRQQQQQREGSHRQGQREEIELGTIGRVGRKQSGTNRSISVSEYHESLEKGIPPFPQVQVPPLDFHHFSIFIFALRQLEYRVSVPTLQCLLHEINRFVVKEEISVDQIFSIINHLRSLLDNSFEHKSHIPYPLLQDLDVMLTNLMNKIPVSSSSSSSSSSAKLTKFDSGSSSGGSIVDDTFAMKNNKDFNEKIDKLTFLILKLTNQFVKLNQDLPSDNFMKAHLRYGIQRLLTIEEEIEKEKRKEVEGRRIRIEAGVGTKITEREVEGSPQQYRHQYENEKKTERRLIETPKSSSSSLTSYYMVKNIQSLRENKFYRRISRSLPISEAEQVNLEKWKNMPKKMEKIYSNSGNYSSNYNFEVVNERERDKENEEETEERRDRVIRMSDDTFTRFLANSKYFQKEKQNRDNLLQIGLLFLSQYECQLEQLYKERKRNDDNNSDSLLSSSSSFSSYPPLFESASTLTMLISSLADLKYKPSSTLTELLLVEIDTHLRQDSFIIYDLPIILSSLSKLAILSFSWKEDKQTKNTSSSFLALSPSSSPSIPPPLSQSPSKSSSPSLFPSKSLSSSSSKQKLENRDEFPSSASASASLSASPSASASVLNVSSTLKKRIINGILIKLTDEMRQNPYKNFLKDPKLFELLHNLAVINYVPSFKSNDDNNEYIYNNSNNNNSNNNDNIYNRDFICSSSSTTTDYPSDDQEANESLLYLIEHVCNKIIPRIEGREARNQYQQHTPRFINVQYNQLFPGLEWFLENFYHFHQKRKERNEGIEKDTCEEGKENLEEEYARKSAERTYSKLVDLHLYMCKHLHYYQSQAKTEFVSTSETQKFLQEILLHDLKYTKEDIIIEAYRPPFYVDMLLTQRYRDGSIKKKIAIEIDGPHHYYINEPQILTGRSMYKHDWLHYHSASDRIYDKKSNSYDNKHINNDDNAYNIRNNNNNKFNNKNANHQLRSTKFSYGESPELSSSSFSALPTWDEVVVIPYHEWKPFETNRKDAVKYISTKLEHEDDK